MVFFHHNQLLIFFLQFSLQFIPYNIVFLDCINRNGIPSDKSVLINEENLKTYKQYACKPTLPGGGGTRARRRTKRARVCPGENEKVTESQKDAKLNPLVVRWKTNAINVTEVYIVFRSFEFRIIFRRRNKLKKQY